MGLHYICMSMTSTNLRINTTGKCGTEVQSHKLQSFHEVALLTSSGSVVHCKCRGLCADYGCQCEMKGVSVLPTFILNQGCSYIRIQHKRWQAINQAKA